MQCVIDTSLDAQPLEHAECGNAHSHLAVTNGSAQLLGNVCIASSYQVKRVFRVNHRPAHEEQKHDSP